MGATHSAMTTAGGIDAAVWSVEKEEDAQFSPAPEKGNLVQAPRKESSKKVKKGAVVDILHPLALSPIIFSKSKDEEAGRRLTVCIGDLHGNIQKVEKLWANLEATLGPVQFAHCAFIFLGDYCDRGPDTKRVLEFLSTLGKRYPHQSHAFIAGNHDYGMAAFLGELPPPHEGFDMRDTWNLPCNRSNEGWWTGEGVETMHAQGRRWGGCMAGATDSVFDSAPTFASYGVQLGDRAALLRAVPRHHKEFLRNLQWVHEARGPPSKEYRGLVAVHAGLSKDRPVEEQLDVLRRRDVTKARLDNLSGRLRVWDTPPELEEKGILVISGHHGYLRTDSKYRLIVDESSGLEHLPLAAVILPDRQVVRDTDVMGAKGSVCWRGRTRKKRVNAWADVA